MSEYEMDWECGFYDEFHNALYNGEINWQDAIRLYQDGKITRYQLDFAKNYLTLKGS